MSGAVKSASFMTIKGQILKSVYGTERGMLVPDISESWFYIKMTDFADDA